MRLLLAFLALAGVAYAADAPPAPYNAPPYTVSSCTYAKASPPNCDPGPISGLARMPVPPLWQASP